MSVISIGIGQCGISIQEKQWMTLLQEYGIDKSGILTEENNDKKINSYFQEIKENVYKPRALFTDLDDGRINLLQNDSLKQLFEGVATINSIEGSHNLFARGKYTVGGDLKDEIQNQLQYLLEQCDYVDSIQIQNSFCGGAGSGLGSLIYSLAYDIAPDSIMNNLVQYPDLEKLEFQVLEIYNTILGVSSQEEVCLSLPFCNQTIQFLINDSYNIQKQKGFDDINNVISQIHPLFTSGVRYSGSINSSTRKICTNLIPFPHLKHMEMTCLPLNYYKQKKYTQLDYLEMMQDSINEKYYLFCKQKPKFLTSYHMIRGADIHEEEIETEYNKLYIQNESIVTEWIPNTYSVSYCDTPLLDNSKSIFSIISSQNICISFQKYINQFVKLYKRKAFLHYYLQEGMDEMEFTEAESNFSDLISVYTPCSHYVEEEEYEEDEYSDI